MWIFTAWHWNNNIVIFSSIPLVYVGEVIAEVRWTFSNRIKKKECESPRQREREQSAAFQRVQCVWVEKTDSLSGRSVGFSVQALRQTRLGPESVQHARPRVGRSVGAVGDTVHPMINETQRPDSFTVYTESERRVETRMMKLSFSVSLITMFWFCCASVVHCQCRWEDTIQTDYFDCNYWNVIRSKLEV